MKKKVTKAGGSHAWPVKFIGANEIEKNLNTLKFYNKGLQGSTTSKNQVTNQVTNLECKAILVNSDGMVCEMKTNSLYLGLLYKAKTGELKAVMDIEPLKDLEDSQRCSYYISLIEPMLLYPNILSI